MNQVLKMVKYGSMGLAGLVIVVFLIKTFINVGGAVSELEELYADNPILIEEFKSDTVWTQIAHNGLLCAKVLIGIALIAMVLGVILGIISDLKAGMVLLGGAAALCLILVIMHFVTGVDHAMLDNPEEIAAATIDKASGAIYGVYALIVIAIGAVLFDAVRGALLNR